MVLSFIISLHRSRSRMNIEFLEKLRFIWKCFILLIVGFYLKFSIESKSKVWNFVFAIFLSLMLDSQYILQLHSSYLSFISYFPATAFLSLQYLSHEVTEFKPFISLLLSFPHSFSAYNMVACRITDARNGANATDSQVPLKK